MKQLSFHQIQFEKSAKESKDWPNLKDSQGTLLPEVAVVGRSNVGKSTLLNELFRVKGLARVSQKPGKTQLLNFFIVDEMTVFVDFPGYGYAKVPNHMRMSWGPMVENYLQERKQLKGMLFLFDIRRIPNEEDLALVQWAKAYRKPLILILTKTDKLNKAEKEKQTQEILSVFSEHELVDYLHWSVKAKGNRKKLIAMIQKMID